LPTFSADDRKDRRSLAYPPGQAVGTEGRESEAGEGPLLRWFLAGYVLIPVLLIYLASFLTPLFHVRYTFTYSAPFYVLVAAGLAWLWRRWRPAMLLSLAVLVVLSGVSIYAYHSDFPYASDDHRGATRFLADRWRPGDAVLINAGYVYTAVVYYWNGDPIAWRGRLVSGQDLRSMPIPEAQPRGAASFVVGHGPEVSRGPMMLQIGTVDGAPSLGWGQPDSDFYAMTREDTAKALAKVFADFYRVWVYRCYDTVTDPDGFIRRWLGEHGTPFEDQVFAGESQCRVQGFLTGRDRLAGATQVLDVAQADGSLTLAASSADPLAKVGGPLDVTLVWRVGAVPADDRILFCGLFDGAGERWAQADERPLGSLYPVANWPEGALVRTPVRMSLPAGTPPGRYRLEVGWYRFVDGQPVWLPWTEGDRLLLGEVEVAAPDDWESLPLPPLATLIGVTVGDQVRLVGLDAVTLEGHPGEAVHLELLWQALQDKPGPGLVVLQVIDDAGRVLAEAAAAPAGGRVPFASLAAGQLVRDRRSLVLPLGLPPGTYNLVLGRQRADRTWLPVRRGLFPLGSKIPLATLRVTLEKP